MRSIDAAPGASQGYYRVLGGRRGFGPPGRHLNAASMLRLSPIRYLNAASMLRLFVGLAAFTSTIPARRFGGHDGATGLAIDKEAVKTAGGALVAAFESCLGADPSAIGVVLDMGANDGRWSAKLMTSMAASVRRRTRLLMFEPQPRFVNALAAITNRFEPSLAGGRVDAGGQPDVPFSVWQ